MSRQDLAREIRIIRRIANAWKVERTKDSKPVFRRVLRQVQRQRRKNWKQGSWASFQKLCQALNARDAGHLTTIQFWAQRPPGAIWDND